MPTSFKCDFVLCGSGKNPSSHACAEWGGNGSFPNLTTLDLVQNALHGPLPEWGAEAGLPELDYLRLSQNGMSSTLPASFAGLASLRHLDISRSHLTGDEELCVWWLLPLHCNLNQVTDA